MGVATAARSEKQVLNERLDDILELMDARGYGSRVEVIRRAVFALPLEDEEHLGRLLQFGGLRYREANGWSWSEEALAECENLLGWWAEDADRAALVRELDELRHRLGRISRELEKLRAVAAEEGPWYR